MPIDAAQPDPDPFARDRERQQRLREKMQPEEDVRLSAPEAENFSATSIPGESPASVPTSPVGAGETSPCFAISEPVLTGEQAERFDFALKDALRRSDFRPGVCLDAAGIVRLVELTQQNIIAAGYTTTRVIVPEQNIASGRLLLRIFPGKIRALRHEPYPDAASRFHLKRTAAWGQQFPTSAGDIFSLRDLEQALENFKRNPEVDVDMRVEAADVPGQSDVVWRFRQPALPFRFALHLDDSGSESTGKYQGGLTFSADNLLGMSDLLYVDITKDFGHKTELIDAAGGENGGGTRAYALHYSLPWGKWLFSFDHNGYRYRQAVAGFYENYDYGGRSIQTEIRIDRLLHRDRFGKTRARLVWWRRKSDNHINDTPIDIQSRRTAGWRLGLSHKRYFGESTLDLDLDYRRGTGIFGAIPAPEEALGEGTSRMKILTLGADLFRPFRLAGQNFDYQGSLNLRHNFTPSVIQDRLSLGNRYTVRGFDGELNLMGERGWYWQNTWAWHYRPEHQIYLGADIGRVAGIDKAYATERVLAGAVLGLRGRFFSGHMNYDLFAGKPLHKPEYFRTAATALGFTLNYSF